MIFDGGSYYTLATGKRFYANGGVIGLGVDLSEGACEGWDGSIDEGFTREEKQEIALHMIARWISFAELT